MHSIRCYNARPLPHCCALQHADDTDCACRHNMVRFNTVLKSVRFLKLSHSFATTGMYSAVSNLGAGGTQAVSLSDTSNAVLYALFALTGLISGGINNRKSLLSILMSCH